MVQEIKYPTTFVTSENVHSMKFVIDRVYGFQRSTTYLQVEYCMCMFEYESEEIEMIVFNHCINGVNERVAKFKKEFNIN
jgi:hypothetical protein